MLAAGAGGLRVWANLACPTIVAPYPLPSSEFVRAWDAEVAGERVFVAAGDAGLYALRLTGQSGQCHRVFMPMLGQGPAAA